MKKKLSMLLTIAFSATSTLSVVACGGGSSNQNELKDIRNFITVIHLDNLLFSGDTPNKEELLFGIIAENPELKGKISVNDFKFTDNYSSTEATIKGVGNFNGKVTLTYKKDTRINLQDFITIEDLGIIIFSDVIPTKEDLLTGIINKNPEAKEINIDNFELVGTSTETQSVINGINNLKGQVTLTYKKDTRIDLNSITNLTGITLTMNSAQKYFELDSLYANADQFKDNLLTSEYSVEYYYTTTTTTEMKNYSQGSGAEFIIIIASNNNTNWKGQTPRIKAKDFGLR